MALPDELKPQVLSALWTKFNSFAPFLTRFFPSLPNRAPGASIMYDVYTYQRRMAALVARNAPAPRGQMPTRSRIATDAITMKEELEPDLCELLDGVAPGSLVDSAREVLVANALRQIRLNFDRRLEWLCAQWMTGGAMLSSNGVPNVEPSGTIYLDWGSVADSMPLSFSAGFQATHIDAGASASWATASTDIKGDLDDARLINMRDSGVETWDVLMNSATYKYLINNTFAQKSLVKNDQVAENGYIRNLWGYTFHIYDGGWYPNVANSATTDEETMASGAGTYYKYIPDNVVIIFSADNVASGRYMLECSPSDADAPPGARGLYGWADKSPVHPHNTVYGLEWTGLPVIMNPDAMYIYTKVTDTS